MSREALILLVEDDDNDVALLRRAIAKADLPMPVSLKVVGNGERAVEVLRALVCAADASNAVAPDLVVLDLKMPRMSGEELLAWRAERTALRQIPAIVLSSSEREADIRRAYELGANSYLVKPVDSHDLVAAVRRVTQYWLQLNLTLTSVARPMRYADVGREDT